MFEPSAELRALQLKCVEIAEVIHTLCVEHGIEYSLCGGSVIGAHLYKGVIPWDDDVDIMMTREHYEKLLKVCETQLPEQYELIHYTQSIENLQILYAKIADKTTTMVENSTVTGTHVSGVFVDITVYDCVPGVKTAQWFQKAARLCYGMLFGFSRRKLLNRILHQKLSAKAKQRIFHLVENRLSKWKPKEGYVYQEFFAHGQRDCFYPVSTFAEYTDVEFEGKTFRIIKAYSLYLEIRYKRKSYEVPEEEQVPQHLHYVDLHKPYQEYLQEGNQ